MPKDGPARHAGPHTLPVTIPPFKPTARPFRRPIPPAPIEPYEIRHPAVPEALDGLTIIHIADLHARKKRVVGPGLRRAAAALEATTADLVLLTGDYMDRPGDEEAGRTALNYLAGAWKPRYGAYATFGNHDTWQFRRRAGEVRGLRWLENGTSSVLPIPGAPLELVGFNEPEDVLGTLLGEPEGGSGTAHPGRSLVVPGTFSIALAHYPSEIYSAADLGIPLVLAGHTHGGQWRLSPKMAPHTSTDLPPDLASGLLRFRGSLCAISRGVGYAAVEFRFNCPPQIPLYTLRRGPLTGAGDRLTCAISW